MLGARTKDAACILQLHLAALKHMRFNQLRGQCRCYLPIQRRSCLEVGHGILVEKGNDLPQLSACCDRQISPKSLSKGQKSCTNSRERWNPCVAGQTCFLLPTDVSCWKDKLWGRTQVERSNHSLKLAALLISICCMFCSVQNAGKCLNLASAFELRSEAMMNGKTLAPLHLDQLSMQLCSL